jgi:hypothetical protein
VRRRLTWTDDGVRVQHLSLFSNSAVIVGRSRSIAFSIDTTRRVGAVCYLLLILVWIVLLDFTKAGGSFRRSGPF